MYQFKLHTLQRGKRNKERLIIQFDAPDMEIIGQFLMTEVAQNGKSFIEKIQAVEHDQTPRIEGAGNICAWVIEKDESLLEDLYYDEIEEVGYAPKKIKTELLKELIITWSNTYDKWQKEESV